MCVYVHDLITITLFMPVNRASSKSQEGPIFHVHEDEISASVPLIIYSS